jgi:hypothetical protein
MLNKNKEGRGMRDEGRWGIPLFISIVLYYIKVKSRITT